MLTDLNIINLAVIEQLQVSFSSGFTVLSGETGAGKSIIIDAMGLLLGQRMRNDLVRSGEESASVEAVFALDKQPAVSQMLKEFGFPVDDTGNAELLIKRTLSRQGKNRVYINGSLATLAQLQQITAPMLAIFGQHDQQQLQRVENHLRLLDRFGLCSEPLSEYQNHYRQLQQLQQQLQKLQRADDERQSRIALLTFQSKEIEETQLRIGEDIELSAERLKLQHAQRLLSSCQQSYECLYANSGAICEQLGAVNTQLEGLQQIDPQLQEPISTIQDSLFALEDAAGQLRQVAETIIFDEGHQQEIEERLIIIGELQRKYHPEISGILAHKEQIDAELEQLTNSSVIAEQLEKQIDQQYSQVLKLGTKLSQKRHAAAKKLQKKMEHELSGLAMPNASFEVQFHQLEQPGLFGMEKIEFYFSANPGQQTRPLAATASGGELSRLMLALRKSAPAADGLATMIFDEVDAGIGGVAASAVGERLCSVAAGHQVLCITHLPQVAAYADTQLRVEKTVNCGQTSTKLQCLDHEERIHELARMLAGAQLSTQTLAHARDLLRRCQKPELFKEI